MFDFVCKLQASEQSKFNFVLFCIPEIQGLSFTNCARDHKSKCNSINFRPSDALFSPFSQQFKYPKNEDKSKLPRFCTLPIAKTKILPRM